MNERKRSGQHALMDKNVEKNIREDTRNYTTTETVVLPSTQSCVRISNNLDMMHNSYELSAGWRQKRISDTSILWFISEKQMSVRLLHMHDVYAFYMRNKPIGNFTFFCCFTIVVIDVMS